MKYTVTAICIKRLFDHNNEPTGEYDFVNVSNTETFVREEAIDTIENEIFKDCKNEYDVEDHYEYFWNRLNGGYKNWEIVKVLNVEKIK